MLCRFWQELPSWTLLEFWLTCYIFQRPTTALSNSGRTAYFCYQRLEDAWHVLTLWNWLCTRGLSTDGDSDSLSPFPAFLPHPQDIFWPEMCGFKGTFVCEIDVVECGMKTGARFLIFVIEGYRRWMDRTNHKRCSYMKKAITATQWASKLTLGFLTPNPLFFLPYHTVSLSSN